MADMMWRGHRVSKPWYHALEAMAKDFFPVINSSRRTIADQWRLYRMYLNGTGNLAAFPNPNAPHIRVGRVDHAIDFNNAGQVVSWLRARGFNAGTPVAGESWHVEVPDIAEAVAKFPLGPRTLRGGMRGADVRAQVTRLMCLGYLPFPVLGRSRSKFGGWVNTAVKAFQGDHGLTKDGVIGDLTRKRLDQAYDARLKYGKCRRRRPLNPLRRG